MNTAQFASLARLVAQLLVTLLMAHGYVIKDQNGTEALIEALIASAMQALVVWWAHYSHSSDALMSAAVKTSGGAVSSAQTPASPAVAPNPAGPKLTVNDTKP